MKKIFLVVSLAMAILSCDKDNDDNGMNSIDETFSQQKVQAQA